MTERLAILTIGVAVAVGAASSASGDAGRALIAFVATSADSTPSVRLVVPGERRNRILVPGSEVAWSPLGDALAVVTPPDGAGGADLVLVSTGGVVERRLTADVGDERFPSFSPDGSRLAYLALAPALRGTWQARWTLIALDLASGRRTVLADDAVAGRAAWSPDGRSLMYAAWRASSEGLQADLALVAADGSSPVHWLTSTDESERGRIDESGGAWSSDGARIAFIRRPENPNYAGDLWLMRSDGTGEQLLARAPRNSPGRQTARSSRSRFSQDRTARATATRRRRSTWSTWRRERYGASRPPPPSTRPCGRPTARRSHSRAHATETRASSM